MYLKNFWFHRLRQISLSKTERYLFIYFESFFRRSSGKVDEADTTGELYFLGKMIFVNY
jgi:hypothetical protein